MSTRFFDLLRKTLIQEYYRKSKLESKFIMGQEFYIDMVPEEDCRFVVGQLTYLRCTDHEDQVINHIKSIVQLPVNNTYHDNTYFKDLQSREFLGTSWYEFCGITNYDVTFLTVKDSIDSYIALQFAINSDCSTERFSVFIEFICDSLSGLYQSCNIYQAAFSCALSCDTVFVLQRAGLPNDIIKIIESQL